MNWRYVGCSTRHAARASSSTLPSTSSRARFHRKCMERQVDSQFSNADNMALVGILSTQMLHRSIVAPSSRPEATAAFGTLVDRLH